MTPAPYLPITALVLQQHTAAALAFPVTYTTDQPGHALTVDCHLPELPRLTPQHAF